jgi:hypothetical protein
MGRPRFKPTKEDRKMVKSLAVLGIRQQQIARVVGIRSPKTLRKHFRRELSMGSAEAAATVSRVAYEMATSGKYPVMTDFWLRLMDGRSDDSAHGDEEESQARMGSAEMIVERAAEASPHEQEERS